jgi:hypothetical protein
MSQHLLTPAYFDIVCFILGFILEKVQLELPVSPAINSTYISTVHILS